MVLWPQETLDLLIELLGSGNNPHGSNGGPCATQTGALHFHNIIIIKQRSSLGFSGCVVSLLQMRKLEWTEVTRLP